MWVTLSAEHFDWTFLHPLGLFAAWEAAVVEEELEQGQVIVAQMLTQEEIPTPSTVEVLDSRTRSRHLPTRRTPGCWPGFSPEGGEFRAPRARLRAL